MLIDSDFKDYYDVIQAQGVDREHVYRRRTRGGEVPANTIPPGPPSYYYVSDPNFSAGRNEYLEVQSIYVYITVVAYCGQCIPVAIVSYYTLDPHQHRDDSRLVRQRGLYTAEEVLEELGPLPKQYWYHNAWSEAENRDAPTEISERFGTCVDHYANYACDDLLRAAGSPLALFIPEERERRAVTKKKRTGVEEELAGVTVDPVLKDLDFYRVRDPWTCYQDIFQYLSGVLGRVQERDGTDMTDDEQVRRHGFDEAYGFRTRPGGGKKGRRKRG